MNEEEIIENIQDEIELLNIDDGRTMVISPLLQKELAEKLKSLLDLYNKEKAKNKEYEDYFGTPPTFEDNKYIGKDKIRELLQRYDKDVAWANADDHYYFVKFIKELLEEEK